MRIPATSFKVKDNIPICIFSLIVLFILYLSLNGTIYGSDAGRIWQTSKLFVDGGTNYPINTLMPLLSTTIYSIFIASFGYDFQLLIISGLFTILTLMVLWLFIAEANNLNIAISSLFFFLLSKQVFVTSYDLRPYAMANFLLILSMYMLKKYFLTNKGSKYLILSAVFLTLATYTQSLFLVGIGIPFIYYLLSQLSQNKVDKKTMINYYAIVFILLMPWIVYRFMIAGFDFYKAPYTWMYSEGFWSKINGQLFNRPAPRSKEYYDTFFYHAHNLFGCAIIEFFLILGLLKEKNKLYIAWIIAFLIPIILGKIPTEARYLYPIIFPMIILSAIGMNSIIKNLNKKSKIIVLSSIIILAMISTASSLLAFNITNTDSQNSISQFDEFDVYIEPGDGVYFRSHIPAPLLPNNRIYSITDLDLEDAISLITWHSDDDVITVLDKYDIKWIILYSDSTKWEHEFHSWTEIAVGETPSHYTKIKNSSFITKIYETEDFILYEYKK